jgi:tetratricopeptide (TPR) repeat protein
MKTISAYVAVLAGTLVVACGSVSAQVKVWQGSITLPTYEEGKPDPNPPFDTYSTTQFSYPYTLRKNLTGQKQDHVWRAVFLENEYLKCAVLPDIGGHLYTCVDKINGQSMFYANPSIKKAQIGYRGAWAAFGVEYNFPVSHNWVSMSPVDFAYTTRPDGSASVSVGNIDRVYGMQWGVEIVLRPGSTLLEQRVTLYNRSDVRHRYYWWSNAGLRVWDDSHIEYPMQFAASHGFTEVRHWPVGPDGSDLSVIKNQQHGPVSFFVHGSHEPFMGIWNPKTQAGAVHYAEYSELPAKKIWSWGADADGLGWRKALSDDDSAYVEVQGGLFRNQETYAFLDPGQTIRFSEYWMPVRDTGGITRANKVGVVSLQEHGSEVSAALNVNERIPGAQVRLLQNGQTLWSETADLTPEKKWSHSVPLKDAVAKVSFELRDREGKVLLQHTDGKYDWDPESTIKVGPQQIYDTPNADSRTEDEWLKLGTDQELNGKVVLALETYKKGIAKYPDSLILQMAAGRLSAALQHFAEAETLLQAVQKRDTPNAEIAYYLGIAEDGLGHTRDAQTAYGVAYSQAEFRGRAAARIGELQARQGDLHAAQAFLKDAVEAAPLDIRTREQLEAITRAIGDTARADELARLGLAMDPLSDFLKEETNAPDLSHLAADPYRVLRVATEYMNLGLYQKALAVLVRTYPEVPQDQSEPGSVLPQNHLLVLYYAAYNKAKLGKDSVQNWQAAGRLSPSLVFPSTTMDRTVLEAALAVNSSDATAHYLLGTLLFSKGLYDPAIAHWTEAKRLNPKMPILDADMGKAWLHLKGDSQRALVSFREGTENDPTNSDIYVGLDTAMSLSGVSAKERATALGRYPSANDASVSTMPANLVYQLALTRAEAGEYDQALALFKGRFFPSEEGGVSAAQVLFEIKLMQAESDAMSGQCAEAEKFLAGSHSGLVVNEAVSQPYVRMAAIAKACKNPQQSEELLQKAAVSKIGADSAWVAKAQELLGTHDVSEQQKRLQASVASAARAKDTSAFTGWWWYNIGAMQAALNHEDQAREAFNNALLLPDSMMSHHLSRAAIANLDAGQMSPLNP